MMIVTCRCIHLPNLTIMLNNIIITSIKDNKAVYVLESVTSKIINMAKENSGIVTSAMVDSAGISRGNLKYLCDKGDLENVSRGVYTLPDSWDDEMYSLQNRFGKGIYSGETALYLWNLSDRTPINYSMTFPTSYNVSTAKTEGIKCSMVIDAVYNLGITKIQTPGQHTVKCYDMEKTLCDIIKPRSNVDIQLISEAFKQYVKRADKNIPKLSEYSKIMRLEKKVRTYLEVLL